MSDAIYRVQLYRDILFDELSCCLNYQQASKDILIVVHDQLPLLKRCISSIRRNTEDYRILLWDNASSQETSDWIKSQSDIVCVRSDENLGFIKPNNRLAEMSSADYIVLLNSDTEVIQDWDKAMISQIQQHDYAEVGYLGGYLDANGKGVNFGFGHQVDYIPAWCACMPRKTYLEHGLFDEKNLVFAYCEDSDLSMRITESGGKIYALHLGLCIHHENATINEVSKIMDCKTSYTKNHEYIKSRHGNRLKNIS
jgi:GT2 family glycosyltransferase